MLRKSNQWASVLISAFFIANAPVATASASESELVKTRLSDLDVGDYAWKPEASESGDIEIVVSLPLQAVYVYRGGTLIGLSTASTGREGKETPTGSFEILQKRREHYSNLYDDAPMPFMQRLTWDGIALHGGKIPGYAASNGCVRLPNGFARRLFEVTRLGARVHVLDSTPLPEQALDLAGGPGPVTFAGID